MHVDIIIRQNTSDKKTHAIMRKLIAKFIEKNTFLNM